MASQAQIQANRRNARLSTGPRSVEGKAVSRFNALKTGLYAKSVVIAGEDPAELQTLTDDYYRQFQPVTAVARLLVDALISADWQLRRLRKAEAEIWKYETPEKGEEFVPKDNHMGITFIRCIEYFKVLQRRIDAAERSYFRALKQLEREHGAKPEPLSSNEIQPPVHPTQQTENTNGSSRIGFVPNARTRGAFPRDSRATECCSVLRTDIYTKSIGVRHCLDAEEPSILGQVIVRRAGF